MWVKHYRKKFFNKDHWDDQIDVRNCTCMYACVYVSVCMRVCVYECGRVWVGRNELSEILFFLILTKIKPTSWPSDCYLFKIHSYEKWGLKVTRSRWRLNHLRAEPPPICKDPARFIEHKSSVSGNRHFANCHVPHFGHMIKGSYGFKDRSFSL